MVDLVRKPVVSVVNAIRAGKINQEQAKLIMTTIAPGVELPPDPIRHLDFCRKHGIAKSTLAYWIQEEGLRSYRVSHKERYISESEGLIVLSKRRPPA